ncbi:MAG: PAS domain S-box protein [Candidatus Omnitrophota bacterium]
MNELFTLSSDLMCVASTEGYFKELNPAWEKVLGYTCEELLSKPFVEFIHPDDVKLTLTEIEKQIKGQATINFINRYLCKDGSYKWLHWHATPAENNTILYAVARDITQSKRAEEQLQKSEKRYQSLFAASNEGIAIHEIVTDAVGKAIDYRIIDANFAFEKILGIPRDKAIGILASKLYGTNDPPFLDKYAKIAKTGEYNVFDIYFPSMAKHFLISVFSPSRGLFATIFLDITERKRAEELLRESQKNLKMYTQRILAVREEEKKKLSVNLHDEVGAMAVSFNAGLSIIQSDLETKDLKSALQNIRKTKVVLKQEVANFRKIVEELRPPNIDIIGLVGILKEKFIKIAKDRDLKIRFEGQPGKIKLNDQVTIAIYRVTQEAFTNIAKYAKAKNVVVHLSWDNIQLKFSICDDGMGFDVNRALNNSKVFKLGVQGMRERIEALGGAFIIESVMKKGVAIKITVPLSRR